MAGGSGGGGGGRMPRAWQELEAGEQHRRSSDRVNDSSSTCNTAGAIIVPMVLSGAKWNVVEYLPLW